MGCFVVLIAMLSPRLAFALLALFTDRVSLAFDSGFFVPFLGFLFLPWTALAWTLCYAPARGVSGLGYLVVLLALLADLGSYGSSERTRRDRYAV